MKIKGLTKIGKRDVCPYCKQKLKKVPSRKKKCEFCGKYIFVRTRPIDRKKVLVTDREKEEVDKQWRLCNQVYESLKILKGSKYIESIRTLPNLQSLNNAKWELFQDRYLKYMKNKKWGFYRNNEFNRAILLKDEGKLEYALSFFLEVCYLDLNGSNNMGEFNTKISFLASGVIWEINDLIFKLKLSNSEVKELFFKTNKERKPFKNMPVSIKEAWGKLIKELDINRR